MQISRALVSPSDKCRFKFLATRELVEGGERREARQIRKKKKIIKENIESSPVGGGGE